MPKRIKLSAGKAVYDSIADAVKALKNCDYKLIGIAGGSCSGKTYLAKFLAEKLHGSCLSMDDYYIGRSRMKDDNFDHPDAVDLKLWGVHIKSVKEGKAIKRPSYNFVTHEREAPRSWKPFFPVITEGLFTLLKPHADNLDLKIFIEADSAMRLSRRIFRDTALRGRMHDDIADQWRRCVEKMHNQYVAPQRDAADIIIYNNEAAKI